MLGIRVRCIVSVTRNILLIFRDEQLQVGAFECDISAMNDWLLHKVTAAIDWRFRQGSAVQKNAKDRRPPRAVDWPRSTISLSSAQKSHLMSPWMLQGPNTAERRCSLYCAAISHISLCSLAASKRLRPPYSGLPCERRASSPVEWRDCESPALPLLIGQG